MSSPYFKIDNVIINKFNRGLYIGSDCYDSSVINSRFQNCTYGVHVEDASDGNNISFYNCIMFYNDYGISLGQGRNQALYSCDIERNTTCGLSKLNSGDLEVNNCYFELNNVNDIVTEWGSSPIDSLTVIGCSFYQSSTHYTPIRYHGKVDHSQFTFINNNFVNNSDDQIPYAIMQKSNASTLKPVLINNTLTNMLIYNYQNFKGIELTNGQLLDFSKVCSYINGTDGGNTNLTIDGAKYYRLNLGSSGTHTITLPALTDDKKYYPFEFTFINLGGNYQSNQNGAFTFAVDTSVCTLLGHVTIDKTKINQEFKAIYLGYISNRYYWQIV